MLAWWREKQRETRKQQLKDKGREREGEEGSHEVKERLGIE